MGAVSPGPTIGDDYVTFEELEYLFGEQVVEMSGLRDQIEILKECCIYAASQSEGKDILIAELRQKLATIAYKLDPPTKYEVN